MLVGGIAQVLRSARSATGKGLPQLLPDSLADFVLAYASGVEVAE